MHKTIEIFVKKPGDIILNYYNSMEIDINIKSDGSSVTKADLESEEFIV